MLRVCLILFVQGAVKHRMRRGFNDFARIAALLHVPVNYSGLEAKEKKKSAKSNTQYKNNLANTAVSDNIL